MNLQIQSCFLLSLVFVLHIFSFCHCQISPPQNIETFYPNETSTLAPTKQPSPPSPPPEPVAASKGNSSNGKIAIAVVVTAASTILICGIVFILVRRCLRARKRKEIHNNNNVSLDGDRNNVVVVPNGFERIDGNVRGLIVDEDGLDVIYWRKLEGKNSNKDLHKEVLNSPKNKEVEDHDDDHQGKQVKKSKSIQEIPLLRGKSSTSHIPEKNESNSFRIERIPTLSIKGVQIQKPDSPPQPSTPPPPASPSTPSNNLFSTIVPVAPPPAPPLMPARKSPAPPAPPQMKKGSLNSSSKSSLSPIDMKAISHSSQRNSSGKGMAESSSDQVKLKPLHWDKVKTNADHSMVWDKVDRGSFRVDQNLMEALFGYVATNRLSPKGKSQSAASPSNDASAQSTKIFLLDPRKSQNIAIVLKSLAVSRSEILDAVTDGKGLNVDTLEKLSRVCPTEEEQSLILAYKGDQARLAAAESFLYHILTAIPSAFKRLNAMLFRLNYDSEILEIKESLQTIELGCKELKTKGLLVKLLEAVLKAGNRMNAGTTRGNAQAFNLSSLRKLSDVKSNNGKTTLLRFLVEEVIHSEGKRAVLNRNGSLSRNSSRSSNKSGNSESNATSDEEKEREYTMLGLPIVGGISSEFSNVKKAAGIDYDSLVGSISALSSRLIEIQVLVSRCGNGERGCFVGEMDQFLRNAEEELRLVRDKETSVLQILSKTKEYYQGGGSSNESRENNLQLFFFVKDFLGMVDQACIEIARDMQKKNPKNNS